MISTRMDKLNFDDSKTYDISDRVYLPISEELDEEVFLDYSRADRYDNWYFTNGDIYYFKRIGLHGLLSELLGEQISKFMNLPTIEYKVAREDGRIVGLISKSFKKENINYRDAITLDKKENRIIKNCVRVKDYEYDENFKRELISYLLSNYFMGLRDRFANTYIIDNGDSNFRIAPIYDYESAFCPNIASSNIYEDPILTWVFFPESVKLLKNNNEYFENLYNKLMNLDLNDLIKIIEDEKGIEFPEDYKELYLDFCDNKKEYMRKLVK